MSTLSVAGIEVEAGKRVTRVVRAEIGVHTVDVPVIAINGSSDGPQVAITAGIHGAEYVGIEAARRVGMTIDPGQVHGSLVIVPIANTTAFFSRSIYVSGFDGQNLNRMFPGNAQGSTTEVLAAWLFHTVIAPSQYYIDMHGGDMIEALVPFALYNESSDPAVEEAARGMALATGIQRIIKGATSGSTYGAAAAAGIPAVLAEIGGQGVWDETLVEDHKESTLRVLRHLSVLPGEVRPTHNQRLYDTFAWMRAEVDGLFHPTVRVGERVEEGQPIGAIVDYFGRPLQPLHAVTGGEIGFLVTSLAMNIGDPLLAILA